MERLDKINWQHELFTNFPTYKKYDEFDKVNIINYDHDYCKKLENFSEDEKFFCKQITKHLEELSAKQNRELKNDCFYFTYWFYDKIGKKYYKDNKIKNKNVSDQLFNIVALLIKRYPNLEPCRCYESGNPEKWNEEKVMHDYFENYQFIKSNKCDKSNCEIYLRYLTYINKIYDIFYYKDFGCCDYDIMPSYCEPYFNCDDKYDPSDLLKTIKSLYEKLSEDEVNAVINDGSSSVEENGLPHNKYSTRHMSNEVAQISSSIPINVPNEIVQNRFSKLETHHDILNSFYINRFMIITSILGTIIFLYLYYSFIFTKHYTRLFYIYQSTSEGSTLDKIEMKMRKLNKSQNEIYEGKLESYNSESEVEDYNAEKLYFSYHSTKNNFL
ncbi:variable surface protein [Plasmodium gonderi]|uniref:Variable surface protein n=1 Tax=Plasmodium gonderi TaxID=77519 RepID=A0A1Y1JG45_PLAGO|nr:variable surface protein [Plasmodium gonderi]GAW79403.1 variable surface protein [Plasmodium gonderi]